MTNYVDSLGLDANRLLRQLSFLNDRALTHESEGRGSSTKITADLHIACAATLRRDAGAIYLLLGDVEKARDEFKIAGIAWLGLGIFYGCLLLQLAGGSVERDAPQISDAIGWIEQSLRQDQEDFGDRTKRSFEADASDTPRQLLSLIQSSPRPNSNFSRVISPAREQLKSIGALPIGALRVPLSRYVEIFDDLQTSKISDSTQDGLTGLMIRRSDLITAAKSDTYHWRRLQQPAELIDFDLLALGIAAKVGGQANEKMLSKSVDDRGLFTALPFKLARDLY